MDGEKAYILRLLHDIGRKFGTRHMGRIYDGYKYMLNTGYPQTAKIKQSAAKLPAALLKYFPTDDSGGNRLGVVGRKIHCGGFAARLQRRISCRRHGIEALFPAVYR